MEIPRHWRLKGARLRMEPVISEDGELVFPPRLFSLSGAKTSLHPKYEAFSLPKEIEAKLEEVLGSD